MDSTTILNVILLVACVVGGVTLFRSTFSRAKEKEELKMKLSGPRTSFIPSRKDVTLKSRVVGMYYRGIDFPFECDAYLKLDLKNKYNPEAVAVYSSTGVHVGYLPKGDNVFYELLSHGVKVEGYVTAWEPSDGYAGTKKLFAEFRAQVDKELANAMQI